MSLLRRHGMTLVEILAVIVVLALMTTVTIVRLSGSVAHARCDLTRTTISIVSSKLEVFHLIHGRWPGTDEGIAILHQSPTAAYFLDGASVKDAWGRPLIYRPPETPEQSFEVISLGADGAPGGEGPDSDISSLGRGSA